jgi:hypothetical protein
MLSIMKKEKDREREREVNNTQINSDCYAIFDSRKERKELIVGGMVEM